MKTHHPMRLALPLAIITLAIGGCSSSGGGSGSSSPPWGTKDGHLERINVKPRNQLPLISAESNGYGEDQTIAILSTDLGEDHTEFRTASGSESRIHPDTLRLYDEDTRDGRAVNPGNAVASLAAGRRFGVARDAIILGVGVVRPEGYREPPRGGFDLTIKPEDMRDGITHATDQGADVLAIHTAVTDDADEAEALGQAIRDANTIAVVPVPTRAELESGVDGTTEFDAETMGRLLVVGEIAPNNSRPTTSLRPGDHNRERFIVAPGDPVFAAFGNGSDDAQYAGPFTAMGLVAGGAALLNSYHEQVTGEPATPKDVTDRLLSTADRSFSSYNVDVHGQGVLDVRSALQPQGEQSLAGMGDHSLGSTQVETSSAFGDALTQQDAFAQVLTLDSGDWPFLVDLRGRIRQHESRALDRHMDRLANMGWQYGESTRDGGYQITTGQSAGFSPDSYQRGYEAMSFWVDNGPWTMTLQSQADPYLATAYQAMPELDGLRLMGGAPGAAHMTSWREATGASLSWSPNNALTLGSRVWSGRDGESAYRALDDSPRVHRAELMAAVSPVDGVVLGVDVAQQHQSQGLLGSDGAAAMQPGEGATTTATGVMLQWRVASPVTLFSRYEHGWTDVAQSNGLISEFDHLQTQSTSIGGVWRDQSATRWGLVYSEPLRVSSGDISLRVPQGFDGNGGIRFEQQTVSANPSGRQQNFELFMDKPFSNRNSALRLNVMYQLEPGHVADAPSAWAAAGGYQTRF